MNFFFSHCCECDSPSYGSSEQNEETGGFLSKTAISYVLPAKQKSVFIPREKGHSILVAFLAGVRKGRKKVVLAPFRFLANARYAGYRTRNISHSISLPRRRSWGFVTRSVGRERVTNEPQRTSAGRLRGRLTFDILIYYILKSYGAFWSFSYT